jgi:acetyl-CoA/propionyl-CoA carboxylase biotin carboxyl carrier protein
VDSGYGPGDTIPDAYDSLVAKLITSGHDRDQARSRMLRALDEFVIEGVTTTISAHRILLEDPEFVAGTHTTRTAESGALDSLRVGPGAAVDVLLVGGRPVRLWNPAMAASASAAVHDTVRSGEAVAPMQGTIVKVLVLGGQAVEPGDPLVVLETMKMETTIAAPRAGVVAQLTAVEGGTARAGEVLAVVE